MTIDSAVHTIFGVYTTDQGDVTIIDERWIFQQIFAWSSAVDNAFQLNTCNGQYSSLWSND